MIAERGVSLSHTTILRWVQCYVPEFEKRWRLYARPVGTSWRVDETYLKVKGRQHGSPEKITVDGYPATHPAISELKAREVLPQRTKVSTSKYLKNLIEQNHRRVKQRIYWMLGCKR